MKNKNLIILIVAGVVLAALAWMTSREEQPAGTNRIGKTLLPDLAVNDIDELIITSGLQTARVSRVDGTWVLPSRYQYPANFENVRRLMLNLAELKIGQAFHASDRQRDQMALTPAKATTIQLKSKGNTVAELKLGVNREATQADAMPLGMAGAMTDGRYLAIANDPMAYLVADSLHDAQADIKRWLNTTILDVSANAVKSITLSNPDDGTFSLVKNADNKLEFAEGDETFDESKAYALTGALSYLTLQDVADPNASDEDLGIDGRYSFSVSTTNHIVYTVTVSDKIDTTDERYISVDVAYVPPAEADTPPTAQTAEDEAERATNAVTEVASASSDDAARQQAKELKQKLAPWTYRIAGYKANTLVSTRASLIKEPEDVPVDTATEPESTDQVESGNDAAPKTETEESTHE